MRYYLVTVLVGTEDDNPRDPELLAGDVADSIDDRLDYHVSEDSIGVLDLTTHHLARDCKQNTTYGTEKDYPEVERLYATTVLVHNLIDTTQEEMVETVDDALHAFDGLTASDVVLTHLEGLHDRENYECGDWSEPLTTPEG